MAVSTRSILFLLLVGCSMCASFTLPHLVVKASSHYEAGYTVGKYFKDRITGYLDAFDYIQNTLVPFVNSSTGSSIFKEILQLNEQYYPQYFDEMRGVADGAGVSLLSIQLLNLQVEVGGLMPHVTRHDTACSDLMLNTPEHFGMAHNEDASPLIKQFGYLVTYQLGGATAFTSYNYPGYLPGNSFGFNANQMVFTTNALFPGVVAGGLARMFINRHTLEATDVEDAIRRATPRGGVDGVYRSSGWSLNVGSLRERRVLNVEVAHSQYAVYEVPAGNYSHFNMYKELVQAQQWTDESTVHRQIRVDALPAPTTVQAMLDILGDQADSAYPIYRNGQSPDAGTATVATARFDLDGDQMMYVYLYNPATNSTPAISLPLFN